MGLLLVVSCNSLDSIYAQTPIPKPVPEQPLGKLDAKTIPEELLRDYAPKELVAVLAGAAEIIPESERNTSNSYRRDWDWVVFSRDGTRILASMHLEPKGKPSQRRFASWDLSSPNEAPKLLEDPRKSFGIFSCVTLASDGDLAEWSTFVPEDSSESGDCRRLSWRIDDKPRIDFVSLPGSAKATVPGAGGPFAWDVSKKHSSWGHNYVLGRGKFLLREGTYEGPNAAREGHGSQRTFGSHRFALWNVAGEKPLLVGDIMRHWHSIDRADAMPDGKLLATVETNYKPQDFKFTIDPRKYLNELKDYSNIRLYDMSVRPTRALAPIFHSSLGRANLLPGVPVPPMAVSSLAFTPNGQQLYSLANDIKDWNVEPTTSAPSIWVWNVRGSAVTRHKGFLLSGPAGQIDFTPDGNRLIRVDFGRAADEDDPYRRPLVVVTPVVRGLPDFAAEQVIDLGFAPSKSPQGWVMEYYDLAPDSKHMAIAGRDGSLMILRLPDFQTKK
jgi:WD40 repeat protein